MAIFEVALSVANRGVGRVQEGDIVVARNPLGFIGTKEGKNFLWIQLDTTLTLEELNERGRDSKRRRHIPLDNISGIDLARVRDTNDEYQPLLNSPSRTITIVDKDR